MKRVKINYRPPTRLINWCSGYKFGLTSYEELPPPLQTPGVMRIQSLTAATEQPETIMHWHELANYIATSYVSDEV